MKIKKLSFLKSGSDIRGVASNCSYKKNEFTSDVIKRITVAFARWVKSKKSKDFNKLNISIGHDCRISSNRINNIMINTFKYIGINIFDCQIASTPSMAMSADFLSCDASVMISASHMPSEYNGFKFFFDNKSLSSEEITQILDLAEEYYSINFKKNEGNVRKINIIELYSKNIINMIKNSFKDNEKPLEGIKIMIDAGGGCGGFFANNILKPLGADISSSILIEHDGHFKTHIPNPENEKAIEIAKKAVIDSNSDLGIIFDTDVDRAGIINSDGTIFNGSTLIALCSAIVLKENPNSVIVTDSITSDHLKNFIESLGGFQFRYKRGYFGVINAAKKINQNEMPCFLAIETSGHAAFKENNFIDDGAYLAAKIIIELIKLKKNNKDLKYLIKNFKLPKEKKEIRINLKDIDLKLEKIKKNYKKIKNCILDEDNFEGIRLKFISTDTNGWCLIRKSLHEPLIVINIESDEINGAENIYSLIKAFLTI